MMVVALVHIDEWIDKMLNQKGFTLTEMLLGITLILIAVLTIRPVVTQLWRHWQVEQVSTALENAWQTARLAAIQKNQNVTFCGSSDAKHCDGNWQANWLIKHGTSLVSKQQPPVGAVSIRFKSNQPTQLQVNFSDMGATQGQQGRFTLCDVDDCRELVFIRSGRLRVA